MRDIHQYQVVISGVGGQGVLFVTRLLAEAAINKGLPVFTSETHGMAQRGGSVISHLKVGNFFSPLIRPGEADGLIALKAESFDQHGGYLMPGGWLTVNSNGPADGALVESTFCLDADRLAQQLNNPRALNLIMLGFSLAKIGSRLHCTAEDIIVVLKGRLQGNKSLLRASLKALEAGAAYPAVE